jgi:hypothetical protein
MHDDISRRDWIKTVGVAGAGALVPLEALVAAGPASSASTAHPSASQGTGEIVELTSTSEIFIPPRGRGFMKFSFDFPEPSVLFGNYRFGFLVFTDENTYGLDRTKLRAEGSDDQLRMTCAGFVWAGGQERAPGALVATLRRSGTTIEWDVVVDMDRPIKTVTSIVRGVPRGQVSFGAGQFTDARDNELLAGYPFGAGDLHGPGSANGMSTPLLMIQAAPDDVAFVSSLDDRVRPKRFYLAPGDSGYRVEAIYEHDAWRNDTEVTVPRWR